MAKRIKLKDLLDHGFLKPNEEVYMEFRGLHFSARVLPDGKFKTERGIFNSMPEPTFLNLMDDPDYKKWYFNLFEIPEDSPYDWRDTGALSGKEKTGRYTLLVDGIFGKHGTVPLWTILEICVNPRPKPSQPKVIWSWINLLSFFFY